MTRRTAILICSLLLAAGCSSEASSGTSGADTTAADTTAAVTTVADITTTTEGVTPTTPPGPPTTAATETTAMPTATTTPTAPPTTVACRPVGNLYGLSDVSGVSVRRGDCGEGVKQVQDQLNYKLGITLTVDGRFGAGTERAVKDFQASLGLPVDGIVGPQTWVALTDDGT